MKQILSLKTDFNLIDCYKVFAVNAPTAEGLTLRQFEETFNFFHIYPQREELQNLIQAFDEDGDGRLS
jgi:Ca2+-binding EF-hand superfamily protein